MNRNKVKRLFLFAGYNASGIIDDALIYYVRSLSELGDVVLCMDSDCKKSETDKIKKYTIHTIANRHGEYDFGSYKRAYAWAEKKLGNYDFVYMVNDSVYGPMFDIEQYLIQMESWNTDAFGLVENPKESHPHIQSWFIGMRKSVFLSDWFNGFIKNVQHHDNKGTITHLYEHGFSKNVLRNGGLWKCMYIVRGRGIYNYVKKLYRQKMPFMKKVAFTRHDGGLGTQIKYVLKRISPELRDAIIRSANDLYGEKYVSQVLSRNYLLGIWHNMKYGIKKLLRGQL